MTARLLVALLVLAPGTGLARWYDSETGRFLSEDEIPASAKLATPNALEPWAYANGNPLRFTDPDGRIGTADEFDWAASQGKAWAEVSRTAEEGNQVSKALVATYGVVGGGAVAATVGLVCTAAAPVCIAGGWAAAGGALTSGQPTLVAVGDQIESCRDYEHRYGECGFNLGGAVVGATSGVYALSRSNLGRAAVLRSYFAFAPMEVEGAQSSAFARFFRAAQVPNATGPLTSLEGAYSSLAGPTAGFKQLANFEQWLASQRALSGIGDAYAELAGLELPELGAGIHWEVGAGDAGRHADFQGPWRAAPTKNFDWTEYLEEQIGPAPPMPRPHGHHVLFKKGIGPAQQALVEEGQTILRRRAGIDPIWGLQNLTFAPNIAGQHDFEALEAVVVRLRALDAANAPPEEFARLMREMAEIAAARR